MLLFQKFSFYFIFNKMIDFACKKLDIEEVIKCSLALSKSDYKILKYLMENNSAHSTEKLASKVGLDKSTVQRSVKKLREKGLVSRGQINQSVGGYLFTYKIKEKEKIRKMITKIIDSWVENVHFEIRNW